MKRALISVLLAVTSSVAFAAATGSGKDVATVAAGTTNIVCDGAKAGGGKGSVWGGAGIVLDPATQTAVFTRSGFDVLCSGNVHMAFIEVSATLAVVGSASAKGNQYFGGHTNGGAIAPMKKCTGTNDACGTADVDSALTQAKTDATK